MGSSKIRIGGWSARKEARTTFCLLNGQSASTRKEGDTLASGFAAFPRPGAPIAIMPTSSLRHCCWNTCSLPGRASPIARLIPTVRPVVLSTAMTCSHSYLSGRGIDVATVHVTIRRIFRRRFAPYSPLAAHPKPGSPAAQRHEGPA